MNQTSKQWGYKQNSPKFDSELPAPALPISLWEATGELAENIPNCSMFGSYPAAAAYNRPASAVGLCRPFCKNAAFWLAAEAAGKVAVVPGNKDGMPNLPKFEDAWRPVVLKGVPTREARLAWFSWAKSAAWSTPPAPFNPFKPDSAATPGFNPGIRPASSGRKSCWVAWLTCCWWWFWLWWWSEKKRERNDGRKTYIGQGQGHLIKRRIWI